MLPQTYKIIIVLNFSFSMVFAQEASSNLESIIEEYVAGNEDINSSVNEIAEQLYYFQNHPININRTNEEELSRLVFLNPFQVTALLGYRQKVGQIFSYYELFSLPEFSHSTVELLKHFLTFDDPPLSKTYRNHSDFYALYAQNIETAAGFLPDTTGRKNYAGIPPKLLLKFQSENPNTYKISITAENDSGEDFFTGFNQQGFDFYSAFVELNSNHNQIIIGDYQVKCGQGLIQWSGYGKRKLSEGVGIRALGEGIRGNSSSAESGFYRGLAAKTQRSNFAITSFYSDKNEDANVAESDPIGNPLIISSIKSDGYHRSWSEISDRNSLRLKTFGTVAQFKTNIISVGFNTLHQELSVLLIPDLNRSNYYRFSGDQNTNISSDFFLNLNKVHVFGELAWSSSKSMAMLTGFESRPSGQTAFSVLYRNIAANFHSIAGNAFIESTKVENETGLYVGYSLIPFPHLNISGYIDLYQKPFSNYHTNGSMRGTDFVSKATHSISKKIEIYLLYKKEHSFKKEGNIAVIKKDEQQKSEHLRLNFLWKSHDQLGGKIRTEWSSFHCGQEKETGFLALADLSISPTEKIKTTARFSYFNTSDYQSRIYAYENDLPRSFSIPMFYSSGFRYYLNVKYTVSRHLRFYCKVAQTLHTKPEHVIGSGNSRIEGNKKTTIRFLFNWRF